MTSPRNATTTDRGRYYRWGTEEFISVTTALRDGIPKPALVAWGPKMVAEFVAENIEQVLAVLRPNGKDATDISKKACVDLLKGSPYRERDAAADIGTLIHDIAEAHVLGLPLPPYEDKHAGFVRSFEMFLNEWQPEYESTEMSVFNRQYRYAGTLDFIARIPGMGLVLGDYKTSKPGKQGHGIYPETALQLAGYRHAEFAGMPNGQEVPMPEVDACIAVNLRPNGYKVVEVDAGPDIFRTFLYVLQVADFQRNGADHVSAPLPPPAFEEAS